MLWLLWSVVEVAVNMITHYDLSRKLEKDMRDHKNVVDNMKKERILISNFETR